MRGFILKRLDVPANSKLSTELSLPTLKPHHIHIGKLREHGSHIDTANMFSKCIVIWIYIHTTEISLLKNFGISSWQRIPLDQDYRGLY
jgi:hypothetical protein